MARMESAHRARGVGHKHHFTRGKDDQALESQEAKTSSSIVSRVVSNRPGPTSGCDIASLHGMRHVLSMSLLLADR
jgi:hypothetical protein